MSFAMSILALTEQTGELLVELATMLAVGIGAHDHVVGIGAHAHSVYIGAHSHGVTVSPSGQAGLL